jgi:hypothetical protein
VDPADATYFNKTWVADSSVAAGGSWVGNQTGDCYSKGISTMTIFKQQSVAKWESLGWLLLFACLVRLTTLLLKIVPPARIKQAICGSFATKLKHDGWWYSLSLGFVLVRLFNSGSLLGLRYLVATSLAM